jgi:hypothetical protein
MYCPRSPESLRQLALTAFCTASCTVHLNGLPSRSANSLLGLSAARFHARSLPARAPTLSVPLELATSGLSRRKRIAEQVYAYIRSLYITLCLNRLQKYLYTSARVRCIVERPLQELVVV